MASGICPPLPLFYIRTKQRKLRLSLASPPCENINFQNMSLPKTTPFWIHDILRQATIDGGGKGGG